MFNLDFLSQPPQLSFFQKENNKTTFGGILFLIYIIVMLILSTIHILDYCLNDKYEVYYSFIRNPLGTNEFSNDDPDLNPLLNFSFNIYKNNYLGLNEINQDFILFDQDLNFIEQNTTIQMRPSEMNFFIGYTPKHNYSQVDEEEEDEIDFDLGDFGYILEIIYQGYKLEHQKPIPLITNDSNYFFNEEYYFNIDKSTIFVINWEVLKYKEDRGILGLFDIIFNNKNEYTSGYIHSYKSISNDKPIDIIVTKIVGLVVMQNNHEQYSEYQRKKNDIIDLIANIGSLFSSFFSIFVTVFNLYSKNVDSYQIIDKILSKNKLKTLIKKKSTIRNIEFNQTNQNQKKDGKSQLPISTIFVSSNALSKNSGETKVIRETEGHLGTKDNLENKEVSENKETLKIKEIHFIKNLKKLSFKQFFLDSFYLKFFNERNDNKIIDLCNYIFNKYTSIDLLIYNQIMLENLFEDYKWNNQDLSNIDKNKLIFRLKNIH